MWIFPILPLLNAMSFISIPSLGSMFAFCFLTFTSLQFLLIYNFWGTSRRHDFPKSAAIQMGGVLQCNWEAYCDTHGRRTDNISFSLERRGTESTAVQIGGVMQYKSKCGLGFWHSSLKFLLWRVPPLSLPLSSISLVPPPLLWRLSGKPQMCVRSTSCCSQDKPANNSNIGFEAIWCNDLDVSLSSEFWSILPETSREIQLWALGLPRFTIFFLNRCGPSPLPLRHMNEISHTTAGLWTRWPRLWNRGWFKGFAFLSMNRNKRSARGFSDWCFPDAPSVHGRPRLRVRDSLQLQRPNFVEKSAWSFSDRSFLKPPLGHGRPHLCVMDVSTDPQNPFLAN